MATDFGGVKRNAIETKESRELYAKNYDRIFKNKKYAKTIRTSKKNNNRIATL